LTSSGRDNDCLCVVCTVMSFGTAVMSFGTPAAAAEHHADLMKMCPVSSSSSLLSASVAESHVAYYNTETAGIHHLMPSTVLRLLLSAVHKLLLLLLSV